MIQDASQRPIKCNELQAVFNVFIHTTLGLVGDVLPPQIPKRFSAGGLDDICALIAKTHRNAGGMVSETRQKRNSSGQIWREGIF